MKRTPLMRTPLVLLLLVVAVVLAAAPPARAQEETAAEETAVLHGVVRDAETGAALPLASVALEGTPRGSASDDEGRYRIEGLAPGMYTVVAYFVGYRTLRQEIALQPGAERRLPIRLQPVNVQIGELSVEGQRGDLGEEDLGVESLSTADIKALPAVLEPDVFRALQLLPGVKAASDFSSGLYIRGGTPDQTLILLDQTPVYNPTHFFGLFSTFNPDAIENVNLYKGAYPAEFGGRLGSVVDLYSKSGAADGVRGTASAGLLVSRAGLEGPYSRGTWALSVRRSTLEPLLAVLREQDVSGIPRSFHFYDVNGRLTFDASPRDQLSLSVYAGNDQLDFPFLEDASVDVSYGNRLVSATWRHAAGEVLTTSLTATASQYFSRPVFEVTGTDVSRENELYDVSVQGDVEWRPLARHTLKGGARAGGLDVALGRTVNGDERASPPVRTNYAMAYLQDTFRPSDEWQVRAGLRASFYANGDYLRLEPRASMTYQPAPALRVQAGYGRYYQHLTLLTSELFTGIDTWLSTTGGTPPSYGDQFVAGVQVRPQGPLFDGLTLDVEGYYRTMDGLFEVDPYFLDVAGQDYRDAFVFGEGAARGVEVKLEKADGRLSGFLAYTLSQTRRRFPNINVDGAGGAPQYYPPKYDRLHDLRLVSTYRFAPQWRASGVFTYGTGQAYTRPTAQYRVVDFPGTTRNVLVAPFNNARLPAYHRLDLGVARVGRFFGVADYELQVQLINAYGRENTWFYFFEVEDDTVERRTVPQIPVPLPSVSFAITF